MGTPNVKMFTLSTCIHCKRTKEFLTNNNINFEFIDVDQIEGDEKKKALEEMDKIVSKRLYPTFSMQWPSD